MILHQRPSPYPATLSALINEARCWENHEDAPLPARVALAEAEAEIDALRAKADTPALDHNLVEQLADLIERQPALHSTGNDQQDRFRSLEIARAVLPIVAAERKAAGKEALGKPLGYVVVANDPGNIAYVAGCMTPQSLDEASRMATVYDGDCPQSTHTVCALVPIEAQP